MKGFVSESSMNVLVVSTTEATIATVSLNIDGVNHSWQGTAKKVSSDKYNAMIGTKLALGRALIKAGSQLVRQANGLVKSIDDNAVQAEKSKAAPKPSKFMITRSKPKFRPRSLPRARNNGNKASVVVESSPVVTHGPLS